MAEIKRPLPIVSCSVDDKPIATMSHVELVEAVGVFYRDADDKDLRSFLLNIANSGALELYMEKLTTAELVNELKGRQGVECVIVAPYETDEAIVEGPAVVLVVKD